MPDFGKNEAAVRSDHMITEGFLTRLIVLRKICDSEGGGGEGGGKKKS